VHLGAETLRRLRTCIAAVVAAVACFAAPATPRALAIAPTGSVPMACPIESVADVATLGLDTIVLGALPPTEPIASRPYLLCRLGPSGAATWSRTISDVLPTQPASIAVGTSSIYVGWGSIDAVGWTHANVRRFSLDGTQQQSVVTASGNHDEFGDLAAAPDGSVYLTGTTGGLLADVTPRANGQSDAFVRSFDAALSVRWTRQFRGIISTVDDPTQRQGFAFGRAMAADTSGIYLTGVVVGSLPGGPIHRSLDDTFVRRYAADGAVVWTRQFDATYPNGSGGVVELQTHPADIALGADGIHVVGQSAWLGDRDIERREDAFQRVYTRAGAVVWTREVGGPNDDGAIKVLPDATGSVMFGFAPEGLAAESGPSSMFLVRFTATGSVAGALEYNPDAWWLSGAQVAGDGTLVRIASVVESSPSNQPGDTRLIPPAGRNILKVDALPPSVGTPATKLVTRSTVASTLVPLDVSWTASDGGSAVADSDVQVSRNGGAWQSLVVPTAATRSVRTSGAPGGTIRIRARATDGAGNTSGWSFGPTITIGIVQETSSAIVETASWGRVSETGSLGGYVDRTTSGTARASYTFTGRGIAWIAGVSPTRGRADVYVDGVLVAPIDTYASSFHPRTVVYAKTWSSSGKHTVEISNRGTTGRPRIDFDAFVVLK
jgi:hypothetical protein